MKLLPSLKQKKRYLVFEVVSKESFSISEIEKSVYEALHSFLGQLGVAKSSPLLIKEKYKNNKFILKINNKYVDEVKSALILIKKIKNVSVIVKSIITSGTLKTASLKL